MSIVEKVYGPTVAHSYGLPSDAYLSEEVFAQETLTLFHGSWLCIGLLDDVPADGDVKPIQFAGIPLLIVRDGQSKVKVFHNVCPHRGAELVSEPKNCKGIVCPYHAWAFDLNGKSVRRPHSGGAGVHTYKGIDPDNAGLSEARSANWYGLIFVNISGDAESFESFITATQARIGSLDADSLRFDSSQATTMSFDANWKLVIENFVESYHLPMVHPELEAVNPMREHYQILGADSFIGQGGTSNNTSESAQRTGLPIRADLDASSFYEVFYVYPNLIFGPVGNFTFFIITDPQSAAKTNERLEFAFYGDAAMSDDLADARRENAEFLKLVNSQDIGICEKAQRGRLSPAYTGGIFALPQEATSLHFVKLVAAMMLKDKGQRATDLVELPVENIYHEKSTKS